MPEPIYNETTYNNMNCQAVSNNDVNTSVGSVTYILIPYGSHDNEGAAHAAGAAGVGRPAARLRPCLELLAAL